MLALLLFAPALVPSNHIHNLFKYNEVSHLVKSRLNEDIRVNKISFDDLHNYHGTIHPTKVAKYVIVAMNDSGMHFFLHDDTHIRRCLWDADLAFCEKKETLVELFRWLEQLKKIPNKYNVANTDDDRLISHVFEQQNFCEFDIEEDA